MLMKTCGQVRGNSSFLLTVLVVSGETVYWSHESTSEDYLSFTVLLTQLLFIAQTPALLRLPDDQGSHLLPSLQRNPQRH